MRPKHGGLRLNCALNHAMVNHTYVLTAFMLLLVRNTAAQVGLYTPAEPLYFGMWIGANDSRFQYPETAPVGNYTIPRLLKRPQLGIAISGGGLRAATLGLGYLRALYMLNITARYLSSNSGSSWLTVPFSFQEKVPLTTFLGDYMPPEQLTLKQLRTQPPNGSFDGVIADAVFTGPSVKKGFLNLKEYVEDLQDKISPAPFVGGWSEAVGKAFLEPYGLNADAATFTAASTMGAVHQALATLPPEVQVYTYKPYSYGSDGSKETRPYPIFLYSIIRENATSRFYPCEFTPLYAGCPSTWSNDNVTIGGGYVEPVGLNTLPPEAKPLIPKQIREVLKSQTSGTVYAATNSTAASFAMAKLMRQQPVSITARSNFLVPLKMVAGISSAAISNARQMLNMKTVATRIISGTETLRYWNQVDFSGDLVLAGDGAGSDNTAIKPLLRRKVPKIIQFITAFTTLQNMTADEWAGYQWETSALFGACPENHGRNFERFAETLLPVKEYNARLQVFPKQGYYDLFAALKHAQANGLPTIHQAQYTVLENKFDAVAGGWEVEVLWVVHQQQPAWEAKLPRNIATTLDMLRKLAPPKDSSKLGGMVATAREMIAAVSSNLINDVVENVLGKDDTLELLGLVHYPFVPTFMSNYGTMLTQLLSQQATWQVLQIEQQIKQLLQK